MANRPRSHGHAAETRARERDAAASAEAEGGVHFGIRAVPRHRTDPRRRFSGCGVRAGSVASSVGEGARRPWKVRGAPSDPAGGIPLLEPVDRRRLSAPQESFELKAHVFRGGHETARARRRPTERPVPSADPSVRNDEFAAAPGEARRFVTTSHAFAFGTRRLPVARKTFLHVDPRKGRVAGGRRRDRDRGSHVRRGRGRDGSDLVI